MNASSHGPAGGGTRRPLGIPSASRTSISSAAKSSATGTSPGSRTRRNQGCQPIVAGIGSAASSVIATSSPSSSSANRCVTEPWNGHLPSRSIAIVAASTTRHGRS